MEFIPGVPPTMQISEIPNAGKLSIHGSGVSHVKALNDGEAELRLVGNHLLDVGQKKAGVRHLITILPTKPSTESEPMSSTRLADCTIEAKELKPYVLIFWAVPGVAKLTVKVQASFHVDDLESVPPESGFGAFLLRQHNIVWFAYRTKHMQRWPAHNLLCFHDGFVAPTLIGTGEGACRLELRTPRYEHNGDELVVAI